MLSEKYSKENEVETIVQELKAAGIECQPNGSSYVIREYSIGVWNHHEFELVSGGYLLFSTFDPNEFIQFLIGVFA